MTPVIVQNRGGKSHAANLLSPSRICAVITVFFLVQGCSPRSQKPAIDISVLSRPEPDVVYVELRNRVFNSSPSDFKVENVTEPFPLWGAIVEHGLPNGTATLVCFANGEASLYLSSGAGLAGTSANADVRVGASNLVALAAQQAPTASPTESWPPPAIGEVAFWFLSTNQVLGTRVSDRDLQDDNHPLAKLYRSANALLTQMHLVAAEIQSKTNSVNNKETNNASTNAQPDP
jgi:hypothetical protein